MTQGNPFDSKQRIIQEFVPGKQVTMAHLIEIGRASCRERVLRLV